MPVGRDPFDECAPSSGQPLVGPRVNSPRHFHGCPLARNNAARSDHRRIDRHAKFEIKCIGGPSLVVRKHWTDGRDSLGGERRHQLCDTRSEDIHHLRPRNSQVDDGRYLCRRLGNVWCVEHYVSFRLGN